MGYESAGEAVGKKLIESLEFHLQRNHGRKAVMAALCEAAAGFNLFVSNILEQEAAYLDCASAKNVTPIVQ